MATDLGDGIFSLKEFKNRGVIKLAPDVLVYIGGSLTTQIIAPVASTGNNNLSFNDGITNVSIQNNVDPPGSSTANIDIAAPIYGPKSKYWVLYPDPSGGNSPVRAPLFVPMMEVKIFFKGRFLVNNQPKYYPAFWGLITTIEENYSGGLYKIQLSCVDVLHWWAYSSVNVHPVPESNIMSGGGQNLTVFSTIFGRNNPYQILYKLTTNMGMHEFVTSSWVAQKTPMSSIYPPDLFKRTAKGIMSYWQQRFTHLGNLLKMYGIAGQRVDQNGIQVRNPETTVTDLSGNSQIQQAIQPKDDKQFKIDTGFLRNFEVFADYDNMGEFENAEYMTKLTIATEVKTRCNFEFFQDTNGNFIFKPPFYNLNVKGMLPYTILPNDIISYSMSTNTEELTTVMTVNTPMHKNLRTTSFDLGKGFHMDIDLAKKYGIRYKEITMEYVQNASMARSFALGQMSMTNAKATTGSVTIPGRPEMRLGYPIYIEHKDAFHYVKSINHTFDFGGTFSTTLGLETERRRMYELSPSNEWVILKDKVYRFVTSNVTPQPKSTTSDPVQITVPDTTSQNLLNGEGKIFSMAQGRYELSPRGRLLRHVPSPTYEISVTQTTVPYTDEDGFQVVGSFPYGRNLNPVCISSETSGPPVFKDVYLTTMARPLYKSESESMAPLFFETQEGAVPSYLNIGNQVPTILGDLSATDITTKPDTDLVPTPDQNKTSAVSKEPPVTNGMANDITTATSNQNQNSYTTPETPLVNKSSTYTLPWLNYNSVISGR